MDQLSAAAVEEPSRMNGQPLGFNGNAEITARLDAAVFPVLHAPIRGLFTIIPGVRPDRIMVAICRSVGRIVGMATSSGDLALILRYRADCKKAFDEGVASMKPMPAPPDGVMANRKNS